MARYTSPVLPKLCIDGIALEKHEEDEVDTSDVSTPGTAKPENQVPLLHELLEINKSLQSQTDILRLRIQYESKHFDEEKTEIIAKANSQLQEKDEEIQNLRDRMKNKGSKINNLTEENENKDEKIQELESRISELKLEVNDAKQYANNLLEEFAALQEESGTTLERERLIKSMKQEIEHLRHNLVAFEKELENAREIIRKQGVKIKSYDIERKRMDSKFKQEINKVSLTLRSEIGKLRDIMKSQNDELRALRHQNENMGQDIKEIKEMLMDTARLDRNRKPPGVIRQFNPTLPTVKKDTRRIFAGKRK